MKEEGQGEGDQRPKETKKAGKEHQEPHKMKRLFCGPTSSSGIPHHKVTKVFAGLKGCITIQDASQGETKDGDKKEGIVKQNQARGSAKKEDNDDTGDKDGEKRQNQAKVKEGGKLTGYKDDEGRGRQVPGRGDPYPYTTTSCSSGRRRTPP